MSWPKWDTELFLQINNLGTEQFDWLWIQISGTLIWIPLYGLIIFLLFKKLTRAQASWALLFLIVNVFLTDKSSVYLFKELIQRPRPCHVDELIEQIRLVKGHCGGAYGFVSSHAANVFGLATFMFLVLRKKMVWFGLVLFIWAAVVSYSRVYLGVHYPLDILCGGLLGALCGWFTFCLFRQTLKRG